MIKYILNYEDDNHEENKRKVKKVNLKNIKKNELFYNKKFVITGSRD